MATKIGGAGKNRFSQDERRRDSNHVSFLKHKGFRWLWIALAISGISIAGYLMIDQQPRPNGGSWYGYTLGTIGFGLIIWLSLLGVRKRRINPGVWSLKAWTSAHVYLGLALIVIGTLHTGFQIGWNVHTLAYVLMLLVIVMPSTHANSQQAIYHCKRRNSIAILSIYYCGIAIVARHNYCNNYSSSHSDNTILIYC
jgi:hypothetical protein